MLYLLTTEPEVDESLLCQVAAEIEFVDAIDDERNLIMEKSQETGSVENDGKNKKRELASSNEDESDVNNNENVKPKDRDEPMSSSHEKKKSKKD